MMNEYVNEISNVIKHIDEHSFSEAVKLIEEAKDIFIFGNGGSHAVAEHFSVDLLKMCSKRAYSLSNTSLVTMISNDFGYDAVFSWMVEKYKTNDSLVFVMSTSGTSENILNVINKNVKSVFLTGLGGIKQGKNATTTLVVPSTDTQIVEDVFSIICHVISLKISNGGRYEN